MGSRTISAGLLHDVLEDTDVPTKCLSMNSARKSLFWWREQPNSGLSAITEKSAMWRILRKFFVAMSRDIRVLVIKRLDRLHNMRTLRFVPKNKQRGFAEETMQIYIPLTLPSGMRKIKREMEDLAFKYVEPEKYDKTRKLMKNTCSGKIIRNIQEAFA